MKIILLGYMGSGKSTLGKILAERRNLPFIDLDSYIESKENKEIKEIFKEKGEIYFRKLEHDYLKNLLQSENDFVLALGGGTPCFGNNMNLILEHSPYVFYLRYSPKKLAERLKYEKRNRPLIADIDDENLEDFIRKHIFERNMFYNQAHFIIASDNFSIDESLAQIEMNIIGKSQ
ncbi:shikimate kinase [Capnocytophaga canis]|uniref:shikimate kinase n=1 Tax=Capnocytophaga canis TaxID=1848903 RepID=UPI0015624BD8|nr:shikimate kinase [Capnocytophaga canis]